MHQSLVWASAPPQTARLADLARYKPQLRFLFTGLLEFAALASFLGVCAGLMAEFS
ncbi:MAG: hypothetical protein JOY77_11605 [Alphaproteobacteria bacterium]|nr:hypothetical protein [Alphaproteobacteria bacterium]MBV9063555.1 hypothetical protein [Alphaproteobacteria bacterium]